MIRARMYWERMRVEITGHAGYAEAGKDIVCAGASALTDALMGALQDAETRGRTSAGWKADGEITAIWADPNIGSIQEIKSYFRMFVRGLRNLQEQYPENVEIKEV